MKAKEKERDRAEKRESKRGRNAPPGGIVSIPLFRFGRGTDHCRTPLSLVPCLTLPTVLHPLSFKKKNQCFQEEKDKAQGTEIENENRNVLGERIFMFNVHLPG